MLNSPLNYAKRGEVQMHQTLSAEVLSRWRSLCMNDSIEMKDILLEINYQEIQFHTIPNYRQLNSSTAYSYMPINL